MSVKLSSLGRPSKKLAKGSPVTFWCSLFNQIYPPNAFSNFTPPPLMLADRSTALDLGRRLHVLDAQFTWEYRLRRELAGASLATL